MSTAVPIDTDLLLPDLRIEGFRGIKDLLISRLGRVTLLAGKNGTGKTTILEAVNVYSARGRYTPITRLLMDREETVTVFHEEAEREILAPNWEALFYGRVPSSDSPVSIGPTKGDQVSVHARIAQAQPSFFHETLETDEVLLIRVSFRDFSQEFPAFGGVPQRQRRTYTQSELPSVIQCESVGPDRPNGHQLARYWDNVILRTEGSRAVEALNLIYSNKVEGVAMIGDDTSARRRTGRSAMVRLIDEDDRVPLNSLGDGAVRLFGIALALSNSKDGILLIDEAENGLHHSIQRAFWELIMKGAHENNVQVLATTHSWDCVAGFAMAATELEDVDVALVRIERRNDSIRAVEYPSYDLDVIAQQGIEVR